jgi:peptide/nickel transport system permease protein
MIRIVAICFLVVIVLTTLIPAQYEHQFRDTPNANPSKQFPLGTDDLGRDRFSRLIYGTRVSLLLATAAAVLSCLAAAILGGLAGIGIADKLILGAADLFLSLPWLFLL